MNIKRAPFLIPAVVLAPLLLVACGDDSDADVAATSETTATSTHEVESSSESAASSSSSSESDWPEEVQEAYEIFGSLAPESLFADFDSCNPNGVDDSMACSGPEVGQFQFFASDSKASSTSQLLTQLRGSKVIEDDGDRIVGWSTLGSTAILTVVDTSEGLVLQQMVSTDEVNPTERLYELGLAEEDEQDSSSDRDSRESAKESASESASAAASSEADEDNDDD